MLNVSNDFVVEITNRRTKKICKGDHSANTNHKRDNNYDYQTYIRSLGTLFWSNLGRKFLVSHLLLLGDLNNGRINSVALMKPFSYSIFDVCYDA